MTLFFSGLFSIANYITELLLDPQTLGSPLKFINFPNNEILVLLLPTIFLNFLQKLVIFIPYFFCVFVEKYRLLEL